MLVEWVWDLYGMGKLLEAVDPKLGRNFVKEEIEQLMMIGLWCAHPDSNCRPKISQALHGLKFQVQLPTLPPKMPKPVYSTSYSSSHWQILEGHRSSSNNSCPSRLTSSSIMDTEAKLKKLGLAEKKYTKVQINYTAEEHEQSVLPLETEDFVWLVEVKFHEVIFCNADLFPVAPGGIREPTGARKNAKPSPYRLLPLESMTKAKWVLNAVRFPVASCQRCSGSPYVALPMLASRSDVSWMERFTTAVLSNVRFWALAAVNPSKLKDSE
nr:L-type lectin-domain containing receptor kinase IX.1-like [Ipomoea batatas]